MQTEIRDEDLLIELYDPHPAMMAGFQVHAGIDRGVRVTHLPTGIIVFSSSERSQLQNKARCMEMLMEQLYAEHHAGPLCGWGWGVPAGARSPLCPHNSCWEILKDAAGLWH